VNSAKQTPNSTAAASLPGVCISIGDSQVQQVQQRAIAADGFQLFGLNHPLVSLLIQVSGVIVVCSFVCKLLSGLQCAVASMVWPSSAADSAPWGCLCMLNLMTQQRHTQ
jgi:hypothetical protein